ncbi:MAG TPA: hypothetical protein VMB66_00705, partial [Candidatus Acidoferrales bacterium]|nr:hypothetical protein [Candidatus Acidoferrales bacterium]
AETYERVFSAEALFEVQDELVLRIVSTVADQHGVLPHSISSLIRNKPDDQLSPYEAVLRVFSFHERMSPEEHASVRALLERAVQHAPSDGDCWAMLATLYADEYMFGFSGEPDPLGRAQKAAQRAVELAPSSSLAYQALAQSLFFRREWQAFRPVAERTVALNRADGALHAFIGMLIALAGDWDRGCGVVDAAIQLNPHHPGWYWLTSVFNTYRKRDYRASAAAALRINMPGYFWGPATSAAALGQLGEHAQKALKELLVIRPDFARTARQEFGKWFDEELAEHYVDGLRKAGLHIVDNADASAGGRTSNSSAVRAEEGFWVAVLPFREPSGDTALESLAYGLTEDITIGLSRFPYLQVIARNSAMTYKGRAVDIRSVGRELGAHYVMEGSIRRRGSAVRVSVQLMDAASGTQLWTEVYDREVSGEDTFQIQDDLTDHIVTSVADGYGVLVRSMAAPTRDRNVEELTASELVLRQYAFMQQIHIEEHALLRTGLEKVLEREPNHANGWASLANLYLLEYCDEFNELPDSLERSREATWRAIKIDPTCQMAWRVLAAVHFFAHDFSAFRQTGERAISLNPRDGTTQAFIGTMLAFAGDWERGVAMLQRAMDLSRHHPGWYHNTSFHYYYRKGEYEPALQAAKKINSPDYNWMYVAIAAACGMLGRQQEAAAAIVSLRRCAPEFLELGKIRKVIEKWDPEKDEVERLMVGLQKAGLRYGADSGVAQVESSVSGNLRLDRTPSGSSHAGEGFWVAVLPFKYTGDNRDFRVLAEGLTEEVITGLSRFSYLRVIARGS